ncbi:hypothetical protein PoB_004961300 [Plakobranchus ocellatus]|uniref:Uncharacterized protein n=1 Tax=Plakobranchus ocellatus TaxID=259542 RepID=A0AAV4BU20_9GAST|nr:hypothetical protein PoB_004961300 [Plakobranchus ocellatus]
MRVSKRITAQGRHCCYVTAQDNVERYEHFTQFQNQTNAFPPHFKSLYACEWRTLAEEFVRKNSEIWFLYITSPQQGDFRLSSPPSGQGANGRARILDRRVPRDLRVDSLVTAPTAPQASENGNL